VCLSREGIRDQSFSLLFQRNLFYFPWFEILVWMARKFEGSVGKILFCGLVLIFLILEILLGMLSFLPLGSWILLAQGHQT